MNVAIPDINSVTPAPKRNKIVGNSLKLPTDQKSYGLLTTAKQAAKAITDPSAASVIAPKAVTSLYKESRRVIPTYPPLFVVYLIG